MARRRKKQGKPDYRMSYLLFGLGAVCLALGGWAAYHGTLTLRWPKASAEVVDASLKRYENLRRGQDRPDVRHTFGVHYLYVVNGEEYLGDNIEPYALGMQNSAGAQKMAERFRPGTKVEVAYNPRQPGEAYLIPGPSSFSLILLGIGVLFGLFGMLARRMIRVGPGEDEETADASKAPAKAKPQLDPEIAKFYQRSDNARTPQ